MASQALRAPFYPAISASAVLVKAGETPLPNHEKVGEEEAKVQSVSTIYGWTITESTGDAKAKVRLWDGTSNAGYYITTITLESNESTRDFFPVETPTIYNDAIYLEIVSGEVEGCVFYG
jgi:hypothetical protein